MKTEVFETKLVNSSCEKQTRRKAWNLENLGGKGAIKVEKIKEDSLDSIPSPSTSLKIQIIDRKVYLR